MKYSNPDILEPIPDIAKGRSLSELGSLLFKVILIFGLLLVALDQFAAWIAPKMPFEWERKLAEQFNLQALHSQPNQSASPAHASIEHYLQERIETIHRQAQLPRDMPVTVHYLETDINNAFATLGGQVFVFRGLLIHLTSEEELDAVLAHETGHIYYRHMAKQVSRSLVTLTALASLKISNKSLTQWLLGDANQLALLSHSRAAELEADNFAAEYLVRGHGNIEGLTKLLAELEMQKNMGGPHLEWLQTHPNTDQRLVEAHKQHPNLHSSENNLTPLPSFLRELKTPQNNPDSH